MPEYLEVVEAPRRMKGKGAPRDTLFGVIGMTTYEPMMRSLGGLLITTTKDASPKAAAQKASAVEHHNTEKHLIGKAAKTHIPGVHTGQVPFAGAYLSKVGAMTS